MYHKPTDDPFDNDRKLFRDGLVYESEENPMWVANKKFLDEEMRKSVLTRWETQDTEATKEDDMPGEELYTVSILLEKMSPEALGRLLGSMCSYIHLARHITIDPD